MELKQYWQILMRWLWLIAIGALLAAGTAYAVSSNTEPVYQSTVTLRVDATTGVLTNQYAGVLAAEQKIGTYSQQMTMRPVMEATLKLLGLENQMNSGSLAGQTSVSPVKDTQLIRLSVEHTDPELAAKIANTIAAVFIEQNQEFEQSRYAASKEALASELEQVQKDLEATQLLIDELGVPTTSEEQVELERLNLTLSTQRATYTNLLSNYEQLRIAEASQSSVLVIAEEAIASSSPIRPRTRNNTMLAGAVGAMLAIGVVFLIEYLDDTIKIPDEIMASTGLTTLGAIGQISGVEDSEKLVTVISPRSPLSEAYRSLRTNIQYASVDGPLSSILITSPGPSEGKSTTVANLAIAMAQAGLRVVLIDADLRRPVLHRFFELPNGRGLTTALLDLTSPVTNHVQMSGISNLRVMTSGPMPPNPAELLGSQRQIELMAALEKDSDVILLDSPPVLTVADASVLAPQVGGILLVIEAGRTRAQMLQNAAKALQRTDGRVIGVAMNRLTARRTGYYYYQYYYGGHYERDGSKQKPGLLRGLRK